MGSADCCWSFSTWSCDPGLPWWLKNLPEMQERWVGSLGWEDPLEKGTAIHSSILAWRIPGTGEPGRLLSMGRTESDTTDAT